MRRLQRQRRRRERRSVPPIDTTVPMLICPIENVSVCGVEHEVSSEVLGRTVEINNVLYVDRPIDLDRPPSYSSLPDIRGNDCNPPAYSKIMDARIPR